LRGSDYWTLELGTWRRSTQHLGFDDAEAKRASSWGRATLAAASRESGTAGNEAAPLPVSPAGDHAGLHTGDLSASRFAVCFEGRLAMPMRAADRGPQVPKPVVR
ncbi:unnamed protein product, partial [Polarella glacialis]